MNLVPATEIEAYEWLLIGHLQPMLTRLRMLKPEHWDWSPHPAAATPRTVAVHAWQWLQCDRQHIENPEFDSHVDVAEPPKQPEDFCVAFEAETQAWEGLFQRLTSEYLDQPRGQFSNDGDLNVRWFILHMIQNVIYKHGQLSEVFFALGYDGDQPYTAPLPNPIYAEVRSSLT